MEVVSSVNEIFVDRDPNLFADVLHFMRSARLPARARQDMARLDDLKAEKLFFGFDDMEQACDEALKEFRAALENALKPDPEPTALCTGFVVPTGHRLHVTVSEGKVPCIASATLAGTGSLRKAIQSFRESG